MRLHHLARMTLIVRDLSESIRVHSSLSQIEPGLTVVPGARALALGASALAGARMTTIDLSDVCTTLELIEQPNAQPALESLGWAGFERGHGSTCLQINCQNSTVSAAFYLGLGAVETQKIDAQTRLISLKNSTLRFVSGKTQLPAMDLAHVRLGILSVQLARVGSRGQAGPVRVLRGPDAELIELV